MAADGVPCPESKASSRISERCAANLAVPIGTCASAWAAAAPCATGSMPDSHRPIASTSPPSDTGVYPLCSSAISCDTSRPIARPAPVQNRLPMTDETKIIEVLQQVAGKPIQPSPDESLFESGLLDSFSLTDLVSALEREYDIRIPDSDLSPRKFDTVARIQAYVAGRR